MSRHATSNSQMSSRYDQTAPSNTLVFENRRVGQNRGLDGILKSHV
jgi:hypothetical protein